MSYISKLSYFFFLFPIFLFILLSFIPIAKLSFSNIHNLSKEYYQISDDNTLKDKIVIITGSTSGLGECLASQLYQLGATVIIPARSSEKYEKTIENIKSKINYSTSGKLIGQLLDVSDLNSVKQFATWYKTNYNHLDILINNAGINYLTNNMKPTKDSPLKSLQGYDLLFASNYLGHFLLSELLLSNLLQTPNSRLILVSSGAHYFVNGSSLDPNPIPFAAQVPDYNDKIHWDQSYSNSKLAQVLHMYALQDYVNNQSLSFTENTKLRRLQVITTQPGFTLTPMVPKLLVTLLGRFMYTTEAASMSTLWGLFDHSITGPSFLSNTPNFWYSNSIGIQIRSFFFKYGFKKIFFGFAVPINIILQQIFYGKVINDPPNQVVFENKTLINEFYKWSKNEINSYLE